MFIKVVTQKTNEGQRQYHYLVESVRDGKKVRHRTLANLSSMAPDEFDRLIVGLQKARKHQTFNSGLSFWQRIYRGIVKLLPHK